MNSLRRRSAPSVRMPSLPTPLPAMDTGRLRGPAYTVTVSKNRQARPTLVRTRCPPLDQPASHGSALLEAAQHVDVLLIGFRIRSFWQIGCQGLEVVFPAADGVNRPSRALPG